MRMLFTRRKIRMVWALMCLMSLCKIASAQEGQASTTQPIASAITSPPTQSPVSGDTLPPQASATSTPVASSSSLPPVVTHTSSPVATETAPPGTSPAVTASPTTDSPIASEGSITSPPVTSSPVATPTTTPVVVVTSEPGVPLPETSAPVTASPTSSPVTSTPTSSPVTSTPTSSPITAQPTISPVTAQPTEGPTSAPVSTVPRQPRVTTLQSHPSRRSGGIVALPNGSPWCGPGNNPAIWVAGHQNTLVDTPYCYVNGTWQTPHIANLDLNDKFNIRDDPHVIDRHDCGALDINDDGRLDLYCLVGANRGTGVGYNEIYLTRKDGSLRKVLRHGLQRFRGMRTRHTAILKGNGREYVFIASSYGRRSDGRPNRHAMFEKHGRFPRQRWWKRWFRSMRGPWQRYTNASCAVSADVNNDGLDDLIVCNQRQQGYVFVQRPSGGFRSNVPFLHNSQRNWRAATVADFDGDGYVELAVTYHDESQSFLRVFRGIPEKPYFDFSARAYYARPLPYAAPDIEAIDANGDGIMDIYIVQADENRRPLNYCGGNFVPQEWWSGGPSIIMPPTNYTPPNDIAPDLLLVGNPGASFNQRFTQLKMIHSEPGCGYFVKKFGDRGVVLAQGGFVRPGHQLLLEW